VPEDLLLPSMVSLPRDRPPVGVDGPRGIFFFSLAETGLSILPFSGPQIVRNAAFCSSFRGRPQGKYPPFFIRSGMRVLRPRAQGRFFFSPHPSSIAAETHLHLPLPSTGRVPFLIFRWLALSRGSASDPPFCPSPEGPVGALGFHPFGESPPFFFWIVIGVL